MRFALNDNGERVEIDSATEGGHYRCPLCHKDMIQRRGEIRAHHYAHKQYDGCVDDWSYDESEWHDHWTKQFPSDNAEYILCHGTLKHFADIYIPERKLVIEFRSDYISRPDFDRRNSYFAATGNQVIWVLIWPKNMRNSLSKGIPICPINTNGINPMPYLRSL
jgi:competence CoiA-like predicted nuclease